MDKDNLDFICQLLESSDTSCRPCKGRKYSIAYMYASTGYTDYLQYFKERYKELTLENTQYLERKEAFRILQSLKTHFYSPKGEVFLRTASVQGKEYFLIAILDGYKKCLLGKQKIQNTYIVIIESEEL